MLSLCLLSACAPQAPSRVPLDDPARDAQVRLLQEAHRAFVQERYPAAALFFKRFIDDARDSPRVAEARWWLGLAYEQLGDYPSAMAQYRLLAAGSIAQQADGALYEGYALRRLDELRRPHADAHHGQVVRLALRITTDQLPPSTDLAPWLQELVQTGVTAVVIASARAPKPGYEEFTDEVVRETAAVAHRLGLLLWVELDLHQGNGMDVKPEWMATTRHAAWPEDASPSSVDIAHSGYQAYLEAMVRRLVRAECDGVVLSARSATGFGEEFSVDSLRQFAAAFGLRGSPEEIFGMNFSAETKNQEHPPNYWRWIGWKARNYAQLVMRLRNVLRERNRTSTLSIEVHQSALTAPLQGVEQFGEDVAELSRQTGGSVVVRHEGTADEAALEKLGRLLGTSDQVWVGVVVKAATHPHSMGEFKESIVNLAQAGRWNMIIQTESVPSVP